MLFMQQRCDRARESDMTEESNNTAEPLTGQTKHDSIITIQTTLGDEDEDIHRCGRCGEEFSALDVFIQHKLSRVCKHPVQDPQGKACDKDGDLANDGKRSSTDEEGGRLPPTNESIGDWEEEHAETENKDGSNHTKLILKLNEDGRYVCLKCEKTFKTANILRTHLSIHTNKKDFKCDFCAAAFRTKGSLIRHNRRHTDERPYQCNQCGLSFRESGALTRHLKSLTPCTEKIRYNQCNEILFSKDGVCTEIQQPPAVPDKEPQLPVVRVVQAVQDPLKIQVVEDIEQVQQEVPQPVAEAVTERKTLICEAIINSAIALETDDTEVAEQAEVQLPKEVLQNPDAEDKVPEVQVTEACVEVEIMETSQKDMESSSLKMHKCPQCDRTFRMMSRLHSHIKGHDAYKPFRCMTCQKEFLTGYMLKKHMEMHVTERRYKCAECGKLFKAIGHVREHMRAHSNDRPHHCNLCNKSYKTKNALQVHERTHREDKPYACPECTRAFREKGALVRHIRHHTGEKPFKCPKCNRGFAEHGTLNRHMRAKGGCPAIPVQTPDQRNEMISAEEQQECDRMAAAIISGDPHTVLVEFSSVVADTQEYIIGTSAEVMTQPEEVTDPRDNHNQLNSQIMKVVQQVVSQVHDRQQIIVRNVEADEKPGVFDSGDTITIATPESLTEQVAITLASTISNGAVLNTTSSTVMEQDEHYVITSSDEMEIQTVVVV